MTTGMRQDRDTDVYKRTKRSTWLWLALAVIVAAGLVTLALSQHENTNAPNATTGQVQSSGTGSQGSVGHFSEQIVPNSGTQTSTNGDYTTGPDNDAPGTNPPASKGSIPAGQSNATSSGGGNTGVSTATDNMGGAPVKVPNAPR